MFEKGEITSALHSRFLRYLVEQNRPFMDSFKQWLFQPGMLFASSKQWWDAGKRRTAHEGLDLCRFLDIQGSIQALTDQVTIPATFPGTIVKIARDFLGKSIYLRHDHLTAGHRVLYTAYGHTRPLTSLRVGQQVAEGEIIAAIAGVDRRKNPLPPHLHITFAWIPAETPPQRLTWETLGSDEAIELLDPLPILAMPE